MTDWRNVLRRVSCSIPWLALACIALEATGAQGATYYVSTSGSDSNPGTSSSPWRNPQKCARSPIKAGDTCIVRSGTYTDTDSNGAVVYINSNSAAGTSSQPITIKSEVRQGAVIAVPSTHSNNFGFYISRPYYIIEGFDITGGNKAGSGTHGIILYSAASGMIVRSNAIHHIGRAVCSNSGVFTGVLLGGTISNVVIEENRFYSIGRRQSGESGCSTTAKNLDHGIYMSGGSNTTMRRNVFYDVVRGYPIQLYGGTTSNINIYHNTFSGRNSTGIPEGQVMLASTIRGATIKNNISHNPATAMVTTHNLSASNVSVNYNVGTAKMKRVSSIAGVTFSNNAENITNPGFIDSSRYDFRLTSTSYALNRGTSSGVPVVPDGRPDASAYEYSVQNNISSPLTPTGVRTQ